ncbi:replication factor C small subunit [Methanotorris formicicus]|uniref:Replication factor C small subunit n=1 Tax=Methanotorris formicicus Mc-S-70 TaxID=647171 RepID=H1KYI5_9EURY|nr:transcriptional regulator, XRE family [Methanotorris formicicus Mc-S-70]
MEKPWVEKYRPKTLDEVVGHEEIVKRLKKYVEKKSMPHLLFSGPPGVGKCLTGDTKVIVNGEIREIGEVVEEISNGKFGTTLTNNLKVLGIDEYGKIREFNVQYVYKDKTNALIKIKTKMGRELKVTTYHPLLVNNKNGEIKWEKAENLKVGDKLATPRYILFEETDYNEELAEWLGYFIGDGHADKESNKITFTNSDEKLRKRFAELTKKLFKDAKIKERIHKNRTPDIYVNSKEVIALIDKLGLRGSKADKVRIPKEIIMSMALKAFLRAYFDCDGGVEKNSVVLSTASKRMAEDLAYALSRFGIIAKLREKINKNNNKTYYYIVISNSSNLKAFLESIGFSHERKLKKLSNIIKDENPNLDVITIDKEKIKYIRDRLKVKLTRDIEKDNWSYNKCKKIAQELLNEIYYGLEELKEIEKTLEESILIDWNEVEKRRKEIAEKTGIRSDRILEYIKGKRKPSLKNYIKIANALDKYVEKIIDAMRIFAKKYSSYAEIGRILNTWNSSIRIYLESNTQEIEKLEEIRKVELKLVRDILNDEKLMDSISYVLFLASNEIYWDEIVEIEQLNGDFTIYDLHIPKYHNFIGGNLPTILHNTTAALCLARDLFGENWRDNFLELNASVSKNTPILVKIDGKIKRTTFEELDKIYFNTNDENEMYKKVDNLEVLTVDENFKVRWRKVSTVIRHKVDKILRVKFEGGYIELTGNHSIMMLDENGLVSKKASDIKVGDCLLSFIANTEGEKDKLDLKEFEPKDITSRVKVINEFEFDEDTAWMLGLYAAEGAVGFRGETSGQVIYTLGSHEHDLINKLNDIVDKKGFSKYENFTGSGFDRERLSAKQIRILNTQLAKFVEKNFYNGNGRRAKNKRIPDIVYELKENLRVEFLKGLVDGDGYGGWGGVVRISSKSEDLLIDTVWLARISGIESSIFENEARLIWKGKMGWRKGNLLPSEPIIKMIKKLDGKINGNWRYILRHQLYENKKRVSKDKIKQILEMVDVEKLSDGERKIYNLLKKLSETEIHALIVKEIEVIDYNDFVYDVSVPNNEMFFAGNVPILLHNSDERGIDVIRTKVKDFARTKPIGDVPFKIIFLDESDALTSDAQNALRRTMEKYSDICRFILSCNYPSKIIPPIQSRCAIFRFSPLKKEDVVKKLKEIAEKEGLTLTPEGLEAIIYVSEGDMRKAINVLQTAASVSKEIDEEVVYKVSSRARPEEIKKMIELALEGKFIEARELLYKLMVDWGMSGEDVILQIFREIPSLNIDERKKVELVEALGECDYRIVEGANERIQLSALLAKMCNMGK